ncbi:hypothetical protein CRUP_034625 [Coryphaenoides rupestris]|nr:hypothetical protein CRUP_034625 [Coryphaenoides rupestris]
MLHFLLSGSSDPLITLIDQAAWEIGTAVDVLEGLLEEDDEVVQVWYLSGWVCFLQMERAREQWAQETREATDEEQEECDALKEAARAAHFPPRLPLPRRRAAWRRGGDARLTPLYSKLGCDDQPILEHTEQLMAELGGSHKCL